MSTPPTLPSGGGPNGPVSDDALVDHFVANYADGDPRTAVSLLIRSNRSLMAELRSLRGSGLDAAAQRSIAARDEIAPRDTVGDGTDGIEAAADMVIAACDGDARAALKATLVANSYLESELDRICDLVSPGFARGRLRPAG